MLKHKFRLTFGRHVCFQNYIYVSFSPLVCKQYQAAIFMSGELSTIRNLNVLEVMGHVFHSPA